MKTRSGNLLLALIFASVIPSAAAFGAEGKPVGRERDADGDGVSDAQDLCPRTLARPAIWTSNPDGAGKRGCTSDQVLAYADLLLQRPQARLQEAIEFLASGRDLEETSSALKAGLASLEASVERLKAGEACAGATAYGETVESIRRAEGLLADAIPRMRGPLEQEELATGRTTADHVGVGTSQLTGLLNAQAAVGEALRAAVYVEDVVEAPCQAVEGAFTLRGTVDEIDDAASLMRLQDGRVVRYGLGQRRVAKGVAIQSQAVHFTDGSTMAYDPQSSYGTSPGDLPAKPVQCLDLRVAPVQRFPPFSSGPYTLHHPEAYVHGQWLYLEAGMRFGAVSRGLCPTGIGVTFPRYTLKIDMTYQSAQGAKQATVATDLGPASAPVPLPSDLRPGPGTLTVVEQHWSCHLGPQLNVSCSLAGDLTILQHQWTSVSRTGAFGLVQYAQTVFDLEEDDQTGFRPTHVSAVTVDGQYVVSNPPPFKAEGCLVFGNATTCDTDNVADISWHEFGIYNHDFYDPNDLFAVYTTGVDHAAGLRWPYVTGTHNGYEFWYSARLPKLVRDAVNLCPDQPDSFYRYPFYPGFEAGWLMDHGNWQPDGSGHCGTDPFSTCLQRFAFDFGCIEGAEVRAARGGVVTMVKTTSTANQWDCYNTPGNDTSTCDNGNYVFIRHQDGTYGIYWHFQGYTIGVQPGDVVHRGQPLGACGNTGNSSAPHLHFHVQDCSTIDCGFSRLIRFQAVDQVCRTPQNGEFILSNNDPSLW